MVLGDQKMDFPIQIFVRTCSAKLQRSADIKLVEKAINWRFKVAAETNCHDEKKSIEQYSGIRPAALKPWEQSVYISLLWKHQQNLKHDHETSEGIKMVEV